MENLNIGRGFLILSLVLTLNGVSQTIWNGIGHIPAADQVDWTNAGLIESMTPTVADHVFNIKNEIQSGETWYDTFVRGLEFAEGNTGTTIIYFPSTGGVNGVYNFTEFGQTLTYGLNNSNTIIQGDGAGATVLNFNAGGGYSFLVTGEIATPLVETNMKTNSILFKGSKTFEVDNVTGLQPDDWILLEQKDFYKHDDCYECNNWAHIGQVTQIGSISGNEITIKDEASKTYEPLINTGNGDIITTIKKINPIQNVGFENLTIKYSAPQWAMDDCHQCNNIHFEYAVNCWVKGVEMLSTPRHHVVANYSSHIEVSGCYFNDAKNHGGGGYGYGVLLQFCTTNVLVENNIFRKLRHAMAVQAGPNANVFVFNYTREREWNYPLPWLPSQITIHGNYSYANLFEHNIVQEIEADWSTSGIPGFTDPHGYNGPYNAFVRNIVYIGNYQEPPFNIYSDEFGLSNAPIRAFLVAS